LIRIAELSRPATFYSGLFRHTGCGILQLLWLWGASAAIAQNLNVVVSNEIAPPGATVQIKFTLAQPAAIASGELAVNLDSTLFGPVTAIAAFSAAGDAAGYASVNGNRVDIHFASGSGSLGSAAGMPLVVLTVPILATAQPGAQTAITADPAGSTWYSPEGLSPAAPYTVSVSPGTVAVGGTLSVSGVTPVSNLAAGAVVRIAGTGFGKGTAVSIPAASIASEQVASPQEVDVTLAGPTDLGGKTITVTNPDGTQVNFFAAPPVTPLANVGDVFDGAIPLYPTASFPAGMGTFLPEETFGRVALENPNATPVDVLLQGITIAGSVSWSTSFSIPAGSSYNNALSSLPQGGNSVRVYATGWTCPRN